MDRISILLRVAREIADMSAELFKQGAGLSINSSDSEDDRPGVIDEVSPDSEIYRWSNAVLGFMRFVHAIHRYAINPQDSYYLEDENKENDI